MNKKILVLLVLLTINLTTTFANEDKKIGLVLAGGGARGFAHIGVLKILEEEKIPIDYIAGTSMGSIIGALYSMGYSADELQEIVLSNDWFQYFDERVVREDTSINQKFYNDRFLLWFPVDGYEVKLPRGAIKGQYIENFFNEIYLDANSVDEFKDLPIPFACVATDIETGDRVILDKGSLAKAVRASMAIPSVFTPIELNGKLLLDGYLSSNFPVEVVKDMGADIIIGSNLVANLKNKDELNDLMHILEQTTNYPLVKESKGKEDLVDIDITPNLEGYATYDFDKASEMISLGEEAAKGKIEEFRKYSNETKFDEIRARRLPKVGGAYIRRIYITGNKRYSSSALRSMLALETPIELKKKEITDAINNMYSLGYFDKVSYSLSGNDLFIHVEEKNESELKVGFNYNNENYGELYLNLTTLGRLHSDEISLDVVLGKDDYYRLQTKEYIGESNRTVLKIYGEFKEFSEYEFYEAGEKIAEAEVKKSNIGLELSNSYDLHNEFSLGIRRNFHTAKSIIANEIVTSGYKQDYYNDYYIKYLHDSLNDKYFSTKGNYFELEISGSTKGLSDYEFNLYSITAQQSIAFDNKFTLNLGFEGDILTYENTPLTITPAVGGFQNRMDSIEFWGLTTSEIFSDKIISAYAELSYEIIKSIYLFGRYNKAQYFEDDRYFDIEGGGIGIGSPTVVGPVSFIIAKNKNNNTRYYFNIGYYF